MPLTLRRPSLVRTALMLLQMLRHPSLPMHAALVSVPIIRHCSMPVKPVARACMCTTALVSRHWLHFPLPPPLAFPADNLYVKDRAAYEARVRKEAAKYMPQ
jgi:hypothetical protein